MRLTILYAEDPDAITAGKAERNHAASLGTESHFETFRVRNREKADHAERQAPSP